MSNVFREPNDVERDAWQSGHFPESLWHSGSAPKSYMPPYSEARYIRADIVADEIARLRKMGREYGELEVAIIMADPEFYGDSNHPDCISRLLASVGRLADKTEAQGDG